MYQGNRRRAYRPPNREQLGEMPQDKLQLIDDREGGNLLGTRMVFADVNETVDGLLSRLKKESDRRWTKYFLMRADLCDRQRYQHKAIKEDEDQYSTLKSLVSVMDATMSENPRSQAATLAMLYSIDNHRDIVGFGIQVRQAGRELKRRTESQK